MEAESKPFTASGAKTRRSLLMGEEWLGRLAALEGLAESHETWTATLLQEVRGLPRVIEEMAASARREIDHHVAIEHEAHQRNLRHLRRDLAACEAELARVSAELGDTRTALSRLASRLSTEIESDQPPPAPALEPRRLSAVPYPGADDAEPARHGVTLAVSGVQRATMGLAIREQLQRLPYIEDVALSDYANAVLQLTVLARRPILLEDALAWEHLVGLHIVGFRPDQIEASMGDAG